MNSLKYSKNIPFKGLPGTVRISFIHARSEHCDFVLAMSIGGLQGEGGGGGAGVSHTPFNILIGGHTQN